MYIASGDAFFVVENSAVTCHTKERLETLP